MKGISLLDGIIVSRTTFEELILKSEFINLTNQNINFAKWKNGFSEQEMNNLFNKKIER